MLSAALPRGSNRAWVHLDGPLVGRTPTALQPSKL